MTRNDERMSHCNFYLVETHVSLALGESRTKRDQEPRGDKLVFRYWSLGLCMDYRKDA